MSHVCLIQHNRGPLQIFVRAVTSSPIQFVWGQDVFTSNNHICRPAPTGNSEWGASIATCKRSDIVNNFCDCCCCPSNINSGFTKAELRVPRDYSAVAHTIVLLQYNHTEFSCYVYTVTDTLKMPGKLSVTSSMAESIDFSAKCDLTKND